MLRRSIVKYLNNILCFFLLPIPLIFKAAVHVHIRPSWILGVFFYKCSNQENILVLVLGTNCRMQQGKQQTVYDNNPELYQNINKENIQIAN